MEKENKLMGAERLYNYYHGDVERHIENVMAAINKLPHGNDKAIIDFYNSYYSTNICEPTRRLNVLYRLKKIAEKYGKRIDDVGLAEFRDFFAKLNGTYKRPQDYWKTWRMMLRFLDKSLTPDKRKYVQILEEQFRMGAKQRDKEKVKKTEILTPDEQIAFINCAKNRGFESYVIHSVGMELGCRKETLCQAIVEECTFNTEKGTGEVQSFDIDNMSKTGQAHWHGAATAKLLFEWVAKKHPLRGTKDLQKAPLFVTRNGKPWTGYNLLKDCKTICRVAGIPKEKAKVHWIWRHLRASYLMSKYNTTVAKELLNFSQRSNTAESTYWHFSRKQGDEIIDAESGMRIKKGKKEEVVPEAPICPICGARGNITDVICENVIGDKKCMTPIGRGLINLLNEHRLGKEEKTEIQQLKGKLETMEGNVAKLMKHIIEEKQKVAL